MLMSAPSSRRFSLLFPVRKGQRACSPRRYLRPVALCRAQSQLNDLHGQLRGPWRAYADTHVPDLCMLQARSQVAAAKMVQRRVEHRDGK